MIEARGLTKRYGDTLAVDDLSFQVRPGHVTGFLGPNGAGKSTTMRMILGLDKPTSGSVTIDGHRYVEHERPLRQIGALLEAKAVHPGRSAYHHLLALAQTNGIPTRRVARGPRPGRSGLGFPTARRKVLPRHGPTARDRRCAARRPRRPASRRAGERVRPRRDPLDPGACSSHWPMKASTVFVSSHLMSEMALMADHLVVIGQGRLIADTTVEQLVGGSSRNSVRVRTPQADQFTWTLAADGAEVGPSAGRHAQRHRPRAGTHWRAGRRRPESSCTSSACNRRPSKRRSWSSPTTASTSAPTWNDTAMRTANGATKMTTLSLPLAAADETTPTSRGVVPASR